MPRSAATRTGAGGSDRRLSFKACRARRSASACRSDSGLVVQRTDQKLSTATATATARLPAEHFQAVARVRLRLVVPPGQRGRTRQARQAVRRHAGAVAPAWRLVDQLQRKAPEPFGGGGPVSAGQRDGRSDMHARGQTTSCVRQHPRGRRQPDRRANS